MSKDNMAIRIADALLNQIADAIDALPEDNRSIKYERKNYL